MCVCTRNVCVCTCACTCIFIVFSRLLSLRNIGFCQKFILHLLKWSCDFFVLESIYVIYYIYGFEQVEPCTFGMPSTLLQYRIFLYVLEFSLRVLYWEILHLSSSKRIVYNFLFVFVVSLCDFDVRVTLSSLRVWCWP